MDSINLCGEFISHKAFGRGQITEHGDGFVSVLFGGETENKKFIYPASIETFLILENTATAKQFKEYTDGIANDKSMARKEEADRATMEKLAVKEHAKQLKKALKKPVKKAVKKPAKTEEDDMDFNETET